MAAVQKLIGVTGIRKSSGSYQRQQIQQKRGNFYVPKLNVTVAPSFCSGRV